ncbi:hypothetical protein NDN16_09455 [Aureimonas altamirensis]|uniref:hypothetical protein n=1 Tax=Aureimonas altamirensis TaxID=370622 RepID=UPI002036DE89|nr:hypothetical protein [Aureimonas altamirensis]MCM2503898.1 hypothetical protein [Aureimonas altamirensis]
MLTTTETEFIDQYLGLTTLAEGQAGLLIWKASPPRTKLAGKLAGSLEAGRNVHRVRVAGRKVPTIVVIAYLTNRRVPTSIDISMTIQPSKAALDGREPNFSKKAKVVKIGSITWDLGMLPDQAYIRDELQDGIKWDSELNRYRLYLNGEYAACFELKLEAIIARAAFRLKDKLAVELRRSFGVRKWGWGWPVMTFHQGKYLVTADGKTFETKSHREAMRRYVLIYKETKKRKLPMKHNHDAFVGVEEYVNYDIETGRFSYKSGKIGNPVFVNGSTPAITYNGNRLSAARVVWYLCKGHIPKERIKPLDGNAANLSLDNLTIETIRRPKKKLVLEHNA